MAEEVALELRKDVWIAAKARALLEESSRAKPNTHPCCRVCLKRWSKGLGLHPVSSGKACDFRAAGPPVVEDQIKHLESSLRLNLPSDYRAWLGSRNGGRPTPNLFAFDDPDLTPIEVVVLFGVAGRPSEELILENYLIGRFKEEEGDVIPIGVDSAGGWICWTPHSLNQSEISHVSGSDKVVNYMCHSFAELLPRLVEEVGPSNR